jgi:hypothetical protein
MDGRGWPPEKIFLYLLTMKASVLIVPQYSLIAAITVVLSIAFSFHTWYYFTVFMWDIGY